MSSSLTKFSLCDYIVGDKFNIVSFFCCATRYAIIFTSFFFLLFSSFQPNNLFVCLLFIMHDPLRFSPPRSFRASTTVLLHGIYTYTHTGLSLLFFHCGFAPATRHDAMADFCQVPFLLALLLRGFMLRFFFSSSSSSSSSSSFFFL